MPLALCLDALEKAMPYIRGFGRAARRSLIPRRKASGVRLQLMQVPP